MSEDAVKYEELRTKVKELMEELSSNLDSDEESGPNVELRIYSALQDALERPFSEDITVVTKVPLRRIRDLLDCAAIGYWARVERKSPENESWQMCPLIPGGYVFVQCCLFGKLVYG